MGFQIKEFHVLRPPESQTREFLAQIPNCVSDFLNRGRQNRPTAVAVIRLGRQHIPTPEAAQ